MSEWAIGKSIDEVKNIKKQTLEELLGGGCDDGKENCVMVAINAFRSLE